MYHVAKSREFNRRGLGVAILDGTVDRSVTAELQPTGNMLRSRDLIAEDTPTHLQILFQSQSFKKSY